jgi:hypothetical protein
VTNSGWEAIFWINIPLAAISLIGVLLLAPADAVNAKEPLRRTIIDSDVPGILAFSATVIAVLMFLLDIPTHPNWWLMVVALLALALFAWRELRWAKPFIDLRLLAANVPLVRVYVCFILVNLLFYTALFGLPQYLEEHAGYSTDVVGALPRPTWFSSCSGSRGDESNPSPHADAGAYFFVGVGVGVAVEVGAGAEGTALSALIAAVIASCNALSATPYAAQSPAFSAASRSVSAF